ncbi:hypothetical protein ABEB36_012900 [Hypothenemus hampei]|uniref:RFTS domain-containing protein n=1 Tax=Hypothenemus hampei TaxID=57062 RepID=A0ABD1E652_HYPHA
MASISGPSKSFRKRRISASTEEKAFNSKRKKTATNRSMIIGFIKGTEGPTLIRCSTCKQGLYSVLPYEGHPNNSIEEFLALTDERLSVFTGKEEFNNNLDQFPTHKITNFSVYDNQGHLCAFDSGLIETDVLLRFSGYIKKIDDEDPSPDNGVAAHDLGPIVEWYNSC